MRDSCHKPGWLESRFWAGTRRLQIGGLRASFSARMQNHEMPSLFQ
jgi:hypothetical protein